MGKRTAPRIISGELRGIRLKSVPGSMTRPITDRVKENLFNILSFKIEGSSFLDLFAGTGSVGVEAYSRGAEFVQFIEKNQKPFNVLKQNLILIPDKNNYALMKADALHYLDGSPERSFDFIFIAPPQYKNIWSLALRKIDRYPPILNHNGMIIVQIDPIEYEELELKSFIETDKRKYGSTLLIFLMHNLT